MKTRTRLRYLLGVLALGAVSLFPRAPSPIAEPGARFECVFNGGFWLESPAVAPDGSVFFSDLTYSGLSGMQAGHIWRYDPRTGVASVFRSPSGMANGIAFDARGDMIVAEGADFGGRRITRTDMRTGKSYILAGLYRGRPFNSPNDLTIDARGRIYFTDPRYLGHEPMEQPVMGIYRLDPDGSVHLLAANLMRPNGIAVSPDQKTLHVISAGGYNANLLEPNPVPLVLPNAIHSYDLLDDGTLRYRRAIVVFPEGSVGDGMTVDTEGNIYVCVGGPPGILGVHVYTPEGERLAVLVPPVRPVNADFGRGVDANLLYVTCSLHPKGSGPWTPPAVNGLYRVRLLKRGFHIGDR